MSNDRHIHATHVDLMPGVPLYVYAIRGDRAGALIDSGIAPMRDAVLALCRRTAPVRYLLLTHAHADHIGCNAAVIEATGAVVAAAGALTWIEDLDVHYREFCLPGPELPDSPEQRAEISSLMDGAVGVDIVLSEGTLIRLGGVDLRTVALPGHKLEEVGFLDEERGDLFIGDVLLALAAPFFHGFQTARGFRASLGRLRAWLDGGVVRRVLAAHHAPLDREAAIAAVVETQAFLDAVEEATLDAAEGVTFESLWRRVSNRLGKQPEFRGYAMLRVQIDELAEDGRLTLEAGRIARS
jgi:glyoxylase-like metal-dependent hydrolase (beta-lactamase superfamily II)